MAVSNSLKAVREDLGLSQEEVARIFREKYGYKRVKQQQVSSWEKGVQPNLEYTLVLSSIYGKTVNELFKLAK